MTPFLNLVAQDLTTRYGENISKVTLVFPSRRAGLFFNTHLAKLIDKPIWTPPIVTINELMQGVANLTPDDPIKLVTKLYHIYNCVKDTNEPFENFYFWGEVMLADFDQIDKYLVDPKQIFSNIKDIKQIEEHFGGLSPEQTEALRDYLGVMTVGQVSELRENYLSVWGILLDIYERFRDELQAENIAYEGMIYRKAAEILANPSTTPVLPQHIAFIGFNALNECEKVLFHRCKRDCGALFYWDYDPVFVDNPNHEAGLFIRQNLQSFPNALSRHVFEGKSTSSKSIKMLAAPSTVAQTKLIPRILDAMGCAGAKHDVSSAIVFPKENILLPALQAIPSDVESLNITMGYPIKETPAYSLAEFLVKLQVNAQRSSEGVLRFYHRDVISILNHPYIRLCEPAQSVRIVSNIKRSNRIYPRQEELTGSNLLEKIFVIQENQQPITRYLLDICNSLARIMSAKIAESDKQQLRIDLEFMYSLHKSLTRIGGVLANVDFEVTHRVFLQLLRKVFAQERVSFSGEPLSGLQIMGFLETRALDFENLIILSFNDDILPGKNHPVSFITPSLRVGFGLPDYKHHDAVYAYYFYRLLNRAKNVYLVFSSRAEGLSSGEKSRFGMQLEMEQLVGKIETIPVGYNLSLNPILPITVEKSDEVMDSLIKNLSRRGNGVTLSPSGLTSYITCPLRFYFRYAVGIDEEDEVTEEVGALEFGRIIHNTMEELYKEYNGKVVSAEMVKSILSNPKHLESILDMVFCEIFLQDVNAKAEGLSGRNLLARNAMLYTLQKMLTLDAQRAPFTLINHEQEVYINLNLPANSSSNQIRLGGFVDRLEQNNGAVWSIDYKTGRHTSKGKFGTVSDLFNPDKVDKCKEVFQTFCYSLALTELYPNTSIKPALWFVKSAKVIDDFNILHSINKKTQPIDDFRVYKDEFEEGLSDLVAEIFDTAAPFTQTTDTNKCRTCPFVGICGRE
ncbi:MAG: PD-(D/E)XK nuclease family protein [Tenuifilaceae bacterium]|jgi:CRISPR/Cas system-associated exonuclease Cas4 (RecB family)|nr:PD-(D/E)XK nuclease family protein [Tenuifilaceae bacterium]